MLLTVIVVLCLLGLLLVFLLLPGESSIVQRAPFWGVNFAHRGLHAADKSVPENSLAAFTAAVDAGYGIELDIQLSKDGEVVVFHDNDLLRVCGVEGRVDSYTWEELRAFRLHGTQHRIPLLEEVLALVNEQAPLIIELKTGPRKRELCESAWRILRRYDGDFCMESFDPRIVRWFKKNVPGLLRGQLSARSKALGSGPAGFVVANLFTNFLARPHFIAYQKGSKPLPARFASAFAMRMVWTVLPGDDRERLEEDNDGVIFELYRPDPVFRGLPSPPTRFQSPNVVEAEMDGLAEFAEEADALLPEEESAEGTPAPPTEGTEKPPPRPRRKKDSENASENTPENPA